MASFPLISIITLNFNNSSVTYRFLESTLSLSYPQYEIIVVDMNSELEKPDADKIKSYKNSVFIYNPANNGFSAGNNLGISQAKGDYILLLNNDTIVTPDLLHSLIATFQLDNKLGIVSPLILQLNNPTKIEYAGFKKMNMYTARTKAIGFNKLIESSYLKVYPSASAHGAAMMIKREVIDAIGYLPEKYFLYYEEWEYSIRAQKKGYHVLFNGKAKIFHEGSVSTNSGSTIKDYYLNRSRILFMRRNANLIQGSIFLLYYIFIVFPKTIMYYLFKNKKGLPAYLSSLNWHLSNKAF